MKAAPTSGAVALGGTLAGAGAVVLGGEIAPFLPSFGGSLELLGLATTAVAGASLLRRLLRASRPPPAPTVSAIRVELVDGLFRGAQERSVFAWWLPEPVLYLDSSLAAVPAYRDYRVWISGRFLRIYRRPGGFIGRLVRRAVLDLAELTGVAFAAFALLGRRRPRPQGRAAGEDSPRAQRGTAAAPLSVRPSSREGGAD